jgi:hypothetical protein
MTTRPPEARADVEVLVAARLLLSRMGVDPAELWLRRQPDAHSLGTSAQQDQH